MEKAISLADICNDSIPGTTYNPEPHLAPPGMISEHRDMSKP